MNRIFEEISSKGLLVPSAVLQQWGWQKGTRVIIEPQNRSIVIKPQEATEYEVARSARTFLVWEVGDATAIKTPVKERDRWRVIVTLPYRNKELGQLTYALDGTLLPEESSTVEQLAEKANED